MVFWVGKVAIHSFYNNLKEIDNNENRIMDSNLI